MFRVYAPLSIVDLQKTPTGFGYIHTTSLKMEVVTWFKNRFGDNTTELEFVLDNWTVFFRESKKQYYVVMKFNSETDAILFKLTWC